MENENIKKKDTAKEKIILFVIGVLVGAVICTAAFFVYAKTLGVGSNTSSSSSQQMPGGGGTPPEMPSGQNRGGTPPEMPSNTNSSQSSNN
ncbi:hypothetical protein J6T21_03630 [Candidatus Saccharibacteria bacterium]|nr:hypothetical protein [Candidatus Saccharibacteria bacterium]